MPYVEADQQRGDLLDQASVLQLPPSIARTPEIFAASSIATCVAFGSSLHTITSQSTSASPLSTSAERLWNAATTETPFGTSSAVCCAAEPCQTPRVRLARPPTLAASGTVASIRTLPERIAGFNCFNSAACPSNGTVSTSRSLAAQAAEFSIPV